MPVRSRLFALGLSLVLAGCATTPPVPNPPEGPALLKVADADTTIYLFGFIDRLDPAIEYRTPLIEAALADSDALVTATPVDPDADYSHVLEYNTLARGESTYDFLDDEQAQAYGDALEFIGERRFGWTRYRPAFMAAVLKQRATAGSGLKGVNAVEEELKAYVGEAKDVGSIIDCETDFGFDKAVNAEQGARFLAVTARNLPSWEEKQALKEQAWMDGELRVMARIMTQDLREAGLAMHYVSDRAGLYAEWVRARLDEPGTVFLTVNAGELAGQGGLIDQLDASGLDVERVVSIEPEASPADFAAFPVVESCEALG